MAVSALVVTLRGDAPPDALRPLEADPRFRTGPAGAGARRVPVVLDTAGPDEDRRAHEWLLGLRGVAFVDVVAVYLDAEVA